MGLYKRSKQLTLQHGLSVESTVKSEEMSERRNGSYSRLKATENRLLLQLILLGKLSVQQVSQQTFFF